METPERSSRLNLHIRVINGKPKEVNADTDAFTHSAHTEEPNHGEEIQAVPTVRELTFWSRRQSDNGKTRTFYIMSSVVNILSGII